MKLKNFLNIFIIFIIFICCVNTINAASDDTLNIIMSEPDFNENSISTIDEKEITSNEQFHCLKQSDNKIDENSGQTNNNIISGFKDNSLATSNDNTLQKNNNDSSKNTGTFTDLKKLIDKSKNELNLTQDYTFNPELDKELTGGIEITNFININGNGHTINGAHKATIFEIKANDITISNINLINGYNEFFGGAIIWAGKNGKIENSKIINNKARLGGGIFIRQGLTIDNNLFKGNKARRGAAIYTIGYDVKIINNIFRDNHAMKAVMSDSSINYKSNAMIEIEENNTFINNEIIDSKDNSNPTNSTKNNKPNNPKPNKQSISSNNIYTKNFYNEDTAPNNQFTLNMLNNIFNFDFTNGFLVLYIDGKLLFNGTTNVNLTQILCNLINLNNGQHEVSVEFTDKDGKTVKYKKNTTF